MKFDSLVSAINKLIDNKLNKFKQSYRQYLAKYGINKQSHVNNPTGGATQDTEARAAINDILDILEENGLMKKS